MGHFEFSAAALRQKDFMLSVVKEDWILPQKHCCISTSSEGQVGKSKTPKNKRSGPDAFHLESRDHTSNRASSKVFTQRSTTYDSYATEPAQWQTDSSSLPSSSAQQADAVDRAESSLVNTVITSTLFSQLTLTEIKKADRHGCIYEAKQTTDEVLYEVRVYSFDRKDPSEKQYVRRNCREWKKRRRFMFSHQENGLVFFILRHPQTTTGSLSLSSLGDGFPPNAANADVFTATRHPLPSLEVSRQPRSSDDSFTSQSLSQTPASSKDNPWSWDSSWKWMYPVGWSRKLLINDEGVPRNGLFLQDFEGGFFNETVPRRIFSPEHLIHPDERDSRGYLRTDTLREQTRNYNPAVCSSPDLIRRLIGFWFSPENLSSDTYLRKHMNSRGFISLGNIARHNKLALNMEVLRSVCKEHESVTYAESRGGDWVRCREGWETWVLPVKEEYHPNRDDEKES